MRHAILPESDPLRREDTVEHMHIRHTYFHLSLIHMPSYPVALILNDMLMKEIEKSLKCSMYYTNNQFN